MVRKPAPPPVVDREMLRALDIDDLAAATVGSRLQAALDELVRARWPADRTRWPLLAGRFGFRTYLLGRAIGLGPIEATVGETLAMAQPTGGVLLALDPLPGAGFCVVEPIRWLFADVAGAPADRAAHEALRSIANVADDGAVFVLPRSSLAKGDDVWPILPRVTRQVAFNAAHHRSLLDEALAASFPPADWRILTDEERRRRLSHVLSEVRAAENSSSDPPSWRALARMAGTSVRTLKKYEPLAEAVTDAHRGAHERRQASLRRHAQRPTTDRRTS